MIYEKVADDLELASHLQEQLNAAGVAAVRLANAPETAEGMTVDACVDCDDPLPAVRIAYKRIRCACCQTEKERLAKLGRT